jgi:folate-binding protein YgfZ
MLRSEWQSYLDQQPLAPDATDGVSYLPELGVLLFSGPDVVNFLQGYLTCDTLELDGDVATPMAVCNLKGRVVVNGWCVRGIDAAGVHAVRLVIDRSLVEAVTVFFKAYVMFSKTELTDVSATTLVFGTLASDSTSAGLRAQLILVDDPGDAQALWNERAHSSATAFELELIEAGIPLLADATSEAFLPQMLDLERLGAVDFDKGCYLGQEVVARAQHRGEVKRRLQRLQWDGARPPRRGDQLSAKADPARKLGTIINSVATGEAVGLCLAVLGNDAPGPFQLHDTVLNRIG